MNGLDIFFTVILTILVSSFLAILVNEILKGGF